MAVILDFDTFIIVITSLFRFITPIHIFDGRYYKRMTNTITSRLMEIPRIVGVLSYVTRILFVAAINSHQRPGLAAILDFGTQKNKIFIVS